MDVAATDTAAALPKVINRHHFHGKPWPRPAVYIGRGTPLGNPFTVAKHGLDALDLYRRWLWTRIKARDQAVLQALRDITPRHHLVCSCAPRPCHGDVVVSAWRWLQESNAQRGHRNGGDGE